MIAPAGAVGVELVRGNPVFNQILSGRIIFGHAKQNLNLVADNLSQTLGAKKRAAILNDWKNLLWRGKLMEIRDQIRRFIKYPAKLKQALNKFNNYF